VREYIILLRRINRSSDLSDERTLEPQAIRYLAKTTGIQVLDVFLSGGLFDAVLILRARSNSDIARLLDDLKGWHTEALLATSHARYELQSRTVAPSLAD
jgi:uncharacterized protein with GYD domain